MRNDKRKGIQIRKRSEYRVSQEIQSRYFQESKNPK